MAEPQIIPPKQRGPKSKMRSPRYYLALMGDIFDQACRGERSTADAQRLTEMASRQLEAWMHTKVLEMNGQDHPIDVAPAAEEDYQAPQVRAHRVKKIAVKRGTGRHGERIDETTVAITSSAEDPHAQIDAEIEAMT